MLFVFQVPEGSHTFQPEKASLKGSSFHLNHPRCFPGDSVGKEPACYTGDSEVTGLIPGSGRTLGEGHGNPLQYSCLEKPMDKKAPGGLCP